jgi:homoserine dehydrogenase
LKVTLLGFGTVGKGLAQALSEKGSALKARGIDIKLVAVSDSKSSAVDVAGLDPSLLLQRKESTSRVGESTTSPAELIREVESDVVVELTPGNPKDGEPALSHIRDALKASRSVVSANKMPLALHYTELIEEAAKRRVMLRYSACVGGGVPMLELGKMCSEVEVIEGFDAILNATSNFILTKMLDENADYESALAEAKRLGFAETNPSLDVDGFDAAAKLVILANHVMNGRLTMSDVHPLQGIRGITLGDLRAAALRGKAVRPLARLHGSAEVKPLEVDAKSPLNVFGATNVVVFHCRDSGERVISGPAGGGVATSRAVLRDLVDIAAHGGIR